MRALDLTTSFSEKQILEEIVPYLKKSLNVGARERVLVF